MANNVHFNISIETNKEQKLKEMLDFVETERQWGENNQHTMKEWDFALLPIYATPYDEEGWYNWGCENMGAKWVSVEEADIHNVYGYSAWSPPIPMINSLAEYLGGDTSIKMTYEDEFRNFIGVAWADGEGGHDFEELDGDEVTQWILEPLGLDDIPEDFEWWEPHPKLDDWTPQEYLDERVYAWFDEI